MKKIFIFCITIFLLGICTVYAYVPTCSRGCRGWSNSWYGTSKGCWRYCSGKHEATWWYKSHSYNISSATCTKAKKCKICGYVGQKALGHSYTKTCSKAHCNSKICSRCGVHKSTCGGDHNSKGYCNHCSKTYCTKSGCGHTCTHNKSGKCENVHCVGDSSKQGWCTLCEKVGKYTHTHNPCSFTVSCQVVHCGGYVCSKCNKHQGTCEGGHKWEKFHKNVEDGTTEDEISRSAAAHIRECTVDGCDAVDRHYFSDTVKWVNKDDTTHIRTCDVEGCGLTQSANHNLKIETKAIDDTNNSHLYVHSKKCDTCGLSNEEEHVDDGKGKCTTCGQLLWRMETADEDITEYVTESDHTSIKEAVKEETISIIEKLNSSNISYVTEVWEKDNSTDKIKAVSNKITITKNGTYCFNTGRGGVATFKIDYINNSLNLVAVKREYTNLGTKEKTITILVSPAETEKEFNKKVYIRQDNGSPINSEEFAANSKVVSDPDSWSKSWCEVSVTSSGVYKFVGKDSLGNEKEITVEVNIVNASGKATVAVSNNIFLNGYVFTDILINPNVSWNKENVSISAYIMKVEEGKTSREIESGNIHIVKILNALRNTVNSNEIIPAGEYYLQITFGGDIFDESGTYIIDLEKVTLDSVETENNVLEGQNRIVVNVLEYKDLT